MSEAQDTRDGFACDLDNAERQLAEAQQALEPFALFYQTRAKAAPHVAAEDSPIPLLSYRNVHLGDKHFRAAAEVFVSILTKGE
ncbi:hypothetical protein LCGC14_1386060 [marine sediment metagenome]|uniref:Uncharacterized protein n=1 Tax=marine sediment metagenome TaxID=412755 RepID=A0A0F9N2V1_9ZZZZ